MKIKVQSRSGPLTTWTWTYKIRGRSTSHWTGHSDPWGQSGPDPGPWGPGLDFVQSTTGRWVLLISLVFLCVHITNVSYQFFLFVSSYLAFQQWHVPWVPVIAKRNRTQWHLSFGHHCTGWVRSQVFLYTYIHASDIFIFVFRFFIQVVMTPPWCDSDTVQPHRPHHSLQWHSFTGSLAWQSSCNVPLLLLTSRGDILSIHSFMLLEFIFVLWNMNIYFISDLHLLDEWITKAWICFQLLVK